MRKGNIQCSYEDKEWNPRLKTFKIQILWNSLSYYWCINSSVWNFLESAWTWKDNIRSLLVFLEDGHELYNPFAFEIEHQVTDSTWNGAERDLVKFFRRIQRLKLIANLKSEIVNPIKEESLENHRLYQASARLGGESQGRERENLMGGRAISD